MIEQVRSLLDNAVWNHIPTETRNLSTSIHGMLASCPGNQAAQKVSRELDEAPQLRAEDQKKVVEKLRCSTLCWRCIEK